MTTHNNEQTGQEYVRFEAKPLYKDDYPEWPLYERRQPYKVNQEWRPPSKKVEGNTTTKQDFPVHELSPRQTYKPVEENRRSNDPFDSHTGYNDVYVKHPLPTPHEKVKKTYEPSTDPFVSDTSNRNDFPNWGTDARQKPFRPDQKWRPSSQKFDGDTTANMDFRAYDTPPRKSMKPVHNPIQSDQPMGDRTGYKDTYKAYTITERPRRPKEEYKPSLDPFQSDTTAKNDFKKYENISPRESMKPREEPLMSDQPMDGRTVNKDTYKAHELQQRFKKPKEEYRYPTERFEGETTHHKDYPKPDVDGRQRSYRSHQEWRPPSKYFQKDTTTKHDFPQHKVPPRESMKPIERPLKSNQPMVDVTGYKETYKAYQLPEKIRKPKEEYRPSSKQFQDDTTAKGDFKKYDYIPPRESMRPRQELIRSEDPIADATGYNDTYRAHPLPERPIRHQEEFKPSLDPFQGDTTARNDFKKYENISPRESMKPREKPLRSDQPMDGQTVNKDTYKAHEPQQRFKKPKEEYRYPTERFEGETTHHKDYPKPDVGGRQRSYRSHQEWRPPSKDFQKDTTTKHDFPQHKVSPRVSMKPIERPLKSDQPMDDLTGYKETYKAYQLPEKTRKPKREYRPSSKQFEDDTTAKGDFKKYDYVPPRESMRPRQEPIPSGIPIADETGYNATYRAHPLPERVQKKQEAHQQPTEKFISDTTNKTDFKHYQASPRESMKPSQVPLKTDAPMDDRTGYKDSFVAHPVQKRFVKEKGVYKPPSQPCETVTTNREDFKEWDGNIVRQKPYGTDKQRKPSSGKFEDGTTTKGDYQAFSTTPRRLMKPVQETQMSKEPMDTKTGYSELYVQHPLQERSKRIPEGYRPTSQPFDGETMNKQEYKNWGTDGRQKPYNVNRSWKPPEGVFDGDTNYKKDFTNKKSDVCPASLLDTRSSKYELDRVDSRGHTVYRPSFGAAPERNMLSHPQKMELLSKA